VEAARAQAFVTADQISETVAKIVADKAEEIAETALEAAVGRVIGNATAGLDAFKQPMDEDPDEVEDEPLPEPQYFQPTEAKRARKRREAAAVKSYLERALPALLDKITTLTKQADGIAYVLDECKGDRTLMRKFFQYWNQQPLSKFHPFVQEPRLAVFQFPGADADSSHMSNETSDELEDVDPDSISAEMYLQPHKPRSKKDRDLADKQLHLDRANGTGGQHYADQQAPHPDAVLLSESGVYRPARRPRVLGRRGGFLRFGDR
jgi:hypothetical protein